MQLNVKTILNLKEKKSKSNLARGVKASVLAAAKNVPAMTACLSGSLSMSPSGELQLFSSTVCDTGKSPLTISYAWYLSEWAKLLSMQEVAIQFKASWHHVYSAVAMAVAWGRERMELTGITAIGVDEIHWSAKRG